MTIDEESGEVFSASKWTDFVNQVLLSGCKGAHGIDEGIKFGFGSEIDTVAVASDILSGDLVGEGKMHVNFCDDFGRVGCVDAHLGASFNGRFNDVDGDFKATEALGAITVFDLIADLLRLKDYGIESIASRAPSAGRRFDFVGCSYFGEAAIKRSHVDEAGSLGFPIAGALRVCQNGVTQAGAEDEEVTAIEGADGDSRWVGISDGELMGVVRRPGDGASCEFCQWSFGVDGRVAWNCERIATFPDFVDPGEKIIGAWFECSETISVGESG